MNKRILIFRFNLIEIALALVILAVGLSSVMVLFPVGMKASRAGVAENNLADVAERVAAFVQSRYTSPELWEKNGTFTNESQIGNFESEAVGSPSSGDFGDTEVAGVDGLIEKVDGGKTYYLYRQYSEAAAGTSNDDKRAIDFEAIVRVGWDADTLKDQYYPDLAGTDPPPQLTGYSRTPATGVEDLPASPMDGKAAGAILNFCCRTLIIEISWPADAPWENRERRIFRVEMFNENFVPYPQTTGSATP